jgi:predicted nucleotidyltransferase
MNRTQTIAKLKSYADAIKALGATSLFLFGSTARNENNFVTAQVGLRHGLRG